VSRLPTVRATGLRRLERWLVGLVMAILAFAIEKAVLRSIKRGGGAAKPPAPSEPFATSRGNEVTGA
jgi:hypothetical protein